VKFEEYLMQYQAVKAFVKGPPGSGKTFLAASASAIWTTLFIDVEGGIRSAIPVVNRGNMELRVVRESDSKRFFDSLASVVGEAVSGKFECVVIDSIGEVAGRMEDQYASRDDAKGVDIKDWFEMTGRVKKFCRLLRDLPCHVIMTCLTKPTGKDEAKTIFEPILPGQTAAMVPSWFDIVALMRKQPEKTSVRYIFTTEGPSIYQVRDRTHTLDGEETVSKDAPHTIWKKIADGMKALAEKG
jgi:hypothetical protein